tara:strand:- start:2 stop:250 length:249 start_codon:yes stop_codon:yes gene_type:complete
MVEVVDLVLEITSPPAELLVQVVKVVVEMVDKMIRQEILDKITAVVVEVDHLVVEIVVLPAVDMVLSSLDIRYNPLNTSIKA